jgi:hypothetical protein
MIRFFMILSLLGSIAFAQSFSNLHASSDTYLNFEPSSKETLPVYIDESSSLVWQNHHKLRRYRSKIEAKAYCSNLHIGDYQWTLPSLQEIKSLSITSNIMFTKSVNYILDDAPVWDNTLSYTYNPKQKHDLTYYKPKKSMYVRCVSRLDD